MITIERLRSFRGFSDVARLFFAQSKTGGCRIAWVGYYVERHLSVACERGTWSFG